MQHKAAWNPTDRVMYIVGGSAGQSNYGDLSSYNAQTSTWSSSPSDLSEPRYAASLVWNSNDNALVLFGGQNLDTNEALASVHIYDATKNSWSSPSIQATPTARWSHVAAWDSGSKKMLVFGGQSSNGLLSDLWEFDYDQEAWSELSPSGTSPSAREGHAAVWDQPATSMFIFGGTDGSSNLDSLFLRDAWE